MKLKTITSSGNLVLQVSTSLLIERTERTWHSIPASSCKSNRLLKQKESLLFAARVGARPSGLSKYNH